MANMLQRVIDDLDLEAATRRGSERNDLLPPRHEDSVAGELGKRFSEGLRTRIERDRYEPSTAVFVSVPKPGHTTRPAALLTLSDRVIYDALVDKLRPRIEAALLGGEIVFWPRGLNANKQWREFENAPLERGHAYIARADITGFYECIDHEILRDTLTDRTGHRSVVNALIEFLGRIMNSSRGIPQGLAASDPLATAYLCPVDAAMAREFLDYYRHGDDVRIGSGSFADARRSLYIFEIEVRRRGLLLNNPKSIIMKAESYKSALTEVERVTDDTREALLDARIGELEDEDRVSEVLAEVGMDELGWDFFYHQTMSFAELVEQLAPHLTPDDTEVASNVFRDAMQKLPGTADGLSAEAFHQRITSALVRLAAAKSSDAVRYAGKLISHFPEKTDFMANYLPALVEKEGPGIIAEVTKVFVDNEYHTDWEKAWLMRVLAKFANSLTSEQLDYANRVANDEGETAFCRVEALKLLALTGRCDHLLVKRLWNFAPVCFHPDLVAAAHHAKCGETWCEAFIAGVKDDPINAVVLRHLASE